jgi:DNA-binding transcriptional MerR regulator
MTTDTRYPLDHLARLSGVPERQIRELVRLRLLPAPSSQGRGATYGTEHLDRLRAWKALRSKVPTGTTNDQIRILLNKLSDKGLLRVIAEGKIPFDLIDDQKQDVTIGTTGSAPSFLARMFRSQEPSSDSESRVFEGEPANQEALTYLAQLRGVPRLVMPSVSSAPRLEVTLEAGQSEAVVPLERLQSALADYVATHAAEVRVKPPESETWHRVTVSRDLEISARGPLMPDEIQLLETIGQLLQQAIYRKEK